MNRKLKLKILKLLDRSDGLTFLELSKALEEFRESRKEDRKRLKLLLMEMEDEELIEERHFPNGRVDYSIENKGINCLERQKSRSFLSPKETHLYL